MPDEIEYHIRRRETDGEKYQPLGAYNRHIRHVDGTWASACSRIQLFTCDSRILHFMILAAFVRV